ncbi:hypothetical protein PHYPSEUDO_012758 [Phytophthora pseudosyringae]|uniref:MSP domain-containing protein n=1 Tax=Phytophthora pseudosyringae TaxID=221518 RepID=A0A8T1V722_9STRA|nr:hypothetical protein PHYPSEUDO_012758 [Phytophthora pseudosyringae]
MELAYAGRARGEPLELSERRQGSLVLRNVTQPSAATLFKVQCTAPRALRVRPALGLLAAAGDAVSIHVQLNPQQESAPATCRLLVVGRRHASPPAADPDRLKSWWTAAEATAEMLVLSETVNIRIRDASASDDEPVTPPLTTTQLAELVLLLMKTQSRRKQNELTTEEQEHVRAARALYASEWPCWEEYATRMRNLLRERNKRKTQTT